MAKFQPCAILVIAMPIPEWVEHEFFSGYRTMIGESPYLVQDCV